MTFVSRILMNNNKLLLFDMSTKKVSVSLTNLVHAKLRFQVFLKINK